MKTTRYYPFFLKTSLLLLLSILSLRAFAWSEKGHRIVAQITRHYLPKAILDSVEQHLGNARVDMAFDTPTAIFHDETLNSVPDMHFIRLEKDQTSIANTSHTLFNQFELTLYNLKTVYRTQESIRLHLKALFYIVADLHQPFLAVSGSEKSDVTVRLNYMGESISLQEAWDKKIIESEKITADQCLVIRLNTHRLKSSLDEGSGGNVISLNPHDWIQHSTNLYNALAVLKQDVPDSTYIKRSVPSIQLQLHNAGLNLAKVLRSLYSASH